jgi:hypothetical protein
VKTSTCSAIKTVFLLEIVKTSTCLHERLHFYPEILNLPPFFTRILSLFQEMERYRKCSLLVTLTLSVCMLWCDLEFCGDRGKLLSNPGRLFSPSHMFFLPSRAATSSLSNLNRLHPGLSGSGSPVSRAFSF